MATVNVVGHFATRSGLAEYALRLGRLIEHKHAVWYRAARHRARADLPAMPVSTAKTPGSTTVWSVNAPELLHERRPTKRNVGVWFWEGEGDRMPHAERAARRLDEVWAPTRFLERRFRGYGKPVRYVPPFLLTLPPPKIARAGDLFVVLVVFDAVYTALRKNPFGAIEAFKKAFAKHERVKLVLKTRFLSSEFFEALQRAADGWPVEVRDGHLSEEEHRALIAGSDCLLSVHRSEGFGLHLAEAFAAGVPVVATGYGGCTDWLTEDNSVVVPYRLAPVGRQEGPFPAHMLWAEPDIDAAAAELRKLFLDRERCEVLGRRARADAQTSLSPERALAAVCEGLSVLA